MQQARLLLAHPADATKVPIRAELERLGYQVTQGNGAQQVCDLLMSQPFDLALLDVEYAAPALLQVQRVPVIVLAAPDQEAAALRCIERGAADYLPSPCDSILLRARVQAHLERQQLRRREQAFREREDVVRFERDLQIARNIQSSFLPAALPQLPGWEIAAHLQPAREVAGDFYDVFPLVNGRRLGIVIADVCDKGVGAALFMALFRSLLRAFANQHTALRWMDTLGDDWLAADTSNRRRGIPSTGTTALKNAILLTNDYIARTHGQTHMFATIFFGLLDPQTGALDYINGGHEPPVIVGADGVTSRLMPTGPIVGAFPDLSFSVRTAQLELGDTLVAFTDGVTEAWSPSGELFTTERVYPLLAQPLGSATDLLRHIRHGVEQHMAGSMPADDITLLAVRRVA